MDALSSLITATGTVVAIAVSLFLLRQGQQDRRALSEERRREQASRVTCWCDWNAESPSVDYDQPHVPAIYVRNTSDQTVYQVFVDYWHPDGVEERIDIGPVPPGETRHRDVVAPIPDDLRWEPSGMLPRVLFTDSNGNAWVRDRRGRLRPDPGPHNDGFGPDGRYNLGLPRPSPGMTDAD